MLSLLTPSVIRGSIVVSIPACHAGDRGSIPRHGDFLTGQRMSDAMGHIMMLASTPTAAA